MPHDQRVSIHALPLHLGRVLTGSEGGQSQPILQVLASHKLNVAGFLTDRGALDDLPGIMERMRRGEVIHALVPFG